MKCSMIWDEMLEWNWMLDDMRRNVLCEGTWKNTMFDNMRRNVLYEEI